MQRAALLLTLLAAFGPRFARGDDLQNLGRDFWEYLGDKEEIDRVDDAHRRLKY